MSWKRNQTGWIVKHCNLHGVMTIYYEPMTVVEVDKNGHIKLYRKGHNENRHHKSKKAFNESFVHNRS